MKECYKYTTLTCDECGGQMVMDNIGGEYYCLKCGLIKKCSNVGRHTLKMGDSGACMPNCEEWREPFEFGRK